MSDKAILICACSGMCPSMKEINFWDLSERIRLELPHKYLIIHPRICEEDGEEMMADLLKDDGTQYVVLACKEEKQKKLLRDGFEKAGVPMNESTYLPLSISFKDTDTVFDELKEALTGKGEGVDNNG